ncbi:MAG: hypothetical protein JSV63_03800 [Candidatus Aenigmatarchaeota archaeon]|nr:MAG: hypothetical protein JSV63_03800 [Candidatus Aenigmarchaeota archaeon]
MEKQTVVKDLLSRGIMVTPETLKKIEELGLESFLQQYKVDAEKIQCSVHYTERPAEMTPQDAIKTSMMRYEKLKKILLTRADAVSISNAGKSTSKICVVGIVKEKTGEGFIIEDSTGEVRVGTGQAVDEGDVIAVRGWMRDNVLISEEILYPDVPLNRKISRMQGTILLTSEDQISREGADIVITPDTLVGQGKERRMPNPAWIFLEKGGKKTIVLVFVVGGAVDRKTAQNWLRKRYLGQENRPFANIDRVMEDIPDVLWIISKNDPWFENYKGVTIVSFGIGKRSLINLKTREVQLK